jgi:hypothetical protein
MSIFTPGDDLAKAGSKIVDDAEQAGEKLAAAGTADLRALLASALDMVDDYKVVFNFSVSIEKKTP